MVRKKFHEIELPIIKKKVEIFGDSKEDIKGRRIKIDLTRKLRGKGLEIIFEIDEEGKAEPYRLHVLGYYIRRSMGKASDYVEDSFSVECKNAIVRVKPILITRKRVSRKIRKVLRNEAREEIKKYFEKKKYQDLFSELLSNKFQKPLSLKLKKIYPLSLCEIRDIYVEKRKSK